MKFSVLQSVYKNDNPFFLEESLASLYENTVKPTEIIIVKDGFLTDKLESVITRWQQKLPIKVVGYNDNLGLAHALNYGLKFVGTDLIARMDSDDICLKNRFEEQLKFFEEHPEAEVVGAGIIEFYFGKNDNEFQKKKIYPYASNATTKTLFKGTPIAHPTLMIKTELLKAFQYLENTSMNEDIELWFRLIKSGHTIYTIQKPLLNFRITDGTFKRRSISKAINEFKIYWSNLLHLFGFNILLIYPILRLIIRFLPYSITKKLYLSNIRSFFFKNSNKK